MAYKVTVFRDTKTGRFVKKSAWKGGKRRGSKRYKRERIIKGKVTREWVVKFRYDKTGRSFDVIVTALTEQEALATAIDFLAHDRNGQKIVKAGFAGWDFAAVKGKVTDEPPGQAEYRDESKEE